MVPIVYTNINVQYLNSKVCISFNLLTKKTTTHNCLNMQYFSTIQFSICNIYSVLKVYN